MTKRPSQATTRPGSPSEVSTGRGRHAEIVRARPPICLPVGKGNRRLHISRGKICPTETQREWLQAGRKIACGSFACAFDRPDGKVVKVTSDPADLSNLILGQEHPRVVRLYDSRELKRSGRARRPYYAAIVEKLERDRNLSRMVNYLPTHLLDKNYDSMERHGKTGDSYRVMDSVKDAFAKSCQLLGERQGSNEQRAVELTKACHVLSDGIIDLHEFFGMHGVKYIDVHGGNFGVDKDGYWRALDVGFAKTAKPDVPILAAPRRRRWR